MIQIHPWQRRLFSVLCLIGGVAALALGLWLQAILLIGGIVLHEVVIVRGPSAMRSIGDSLLALAPTQGVPGGEAFARNLPPDGARSPRS